MQVDGSIKQKSSLNFFEATFISILCLFFLFFAEVVQIRSAFLSRVMGDADVFFRAGWAARVGKNIYQVTDPNGWHYNYPPLFAITMIPLGDPPPGEDRQGFLPYAISISILYKVSLFCLFVGVFFLAKAYETQFPFLVQNYKEKKWYYLRVFAIVVCLSPIAHTLMRGQVNLFLLMMVCLAIGFQISNRSFLSGVMIAASICLKVFPLFLLIVPVWRKDFRQLAGCLLGLVLGLGVIPVSVMGVENTNVAYADFFKVLIGPSLGVTDDNSRGVELTNLNSTDNHSILAFLHGLEYPDFTKKPAKPSLVIKIVYVLMSGLLLGWMLWIRGVPKKGSTMEDAHFFALASLLMVLICPISHSPYFVLSLPLVMSLLVYFWFKKPESLLDPRLCFFMFTYILANILPLLPFFENIKRMGLMVVPNFLLFVYGTLLISKLNNESISDLDKIPISKSRA